MLSLGSPFGRLALHNPTTLLFPGVWETIACVNAMYCRVSNELDLFNQIRLLFCFMKFTKRDKKTQIQSQMTWQCPMANPFALNNFKNVTFYRTFRGYFKALLFMTFATWPSTSQYSSFQLSGKMNFHPLFFTLHLTFFPVFKFAWQVILYFIHCFSIALYFKEDNTRDVESSIQKYANLTFPFYSPSCYIIAHKNDWKCLYLVWDISESNRYNVNLSNFLLFNGHFDFDGLPNSQFAYRHFL